MGCVASTQLLTLAAGFRPRSTPRGASITTLIQHTPRRSDGGCDGQSTHQSVTQSDKVAVNIHPVAIFGRLCTGIAEPLFPSLQDVRAHTKQPRCLFSR